LTSLSILIWFNCSRVDGTTDVQTLHAHDAHTHETIRLYIEIYDADGIGNMWTGEGVCAAETFVSRSTLSYIFTVLLALSHAQCHSLQRAYKVTIFCESKIGTFEKYLLTRTSPPSPKYLMSC
jgi:hypothetical protein